MEARQAFSSNTARSATKKWGAAAGRLTVVLAGSLLFAFVAPSASVAAGSMTGFNPVADTYVDASNPGGSYGSNKALRVDGSPLRTAYLRFDVQGVSDFSSATLHIDVESSATIGFEVRAVADNTWSEGITYATAPPVGAVVASSGPVATGTWIDLDVSALVSGNGLVSLALTTDGSTAIRLASRESTSPPELIVQGTGSSDTEPPLTPGNLVASSIGPFEVDLSWDSTTDNVGVVGYTVYRDGVAIATVEDGTYVYTDPAVQPDTTYAYAFDAYDAAGNHSGLSDVVEVTTPALSSTYTLSADADAYVNADRPDANYGSATALRVDGSPDVRSYLRFRVHGLTGDTVVKRATLRLYAKSRSSVGHDARIVTDNGWDEATITYANAPAIGGVVGSSGPFSADGYVDVDVTPLVSGNGTFSVAVTTAGSTAISYLSRETGGQPQLEIETGAPEPPPPIGTVFSDGFETGDLAQWHQTDLGLVTTQDVVHDGAWAARATATAGTHAYAVAPLPGSVLEATYTTWFNVLSQGGNTLYLMRARRSVSSPLVGVYLTATGKLATRNETSSGAGSQASKTSVEPGWHLLKLHLLVGGSAGSLTEVWLDGVLAVTRTDSLGSDPVGAVEIGDRGYHIGDVVFDDVEVTTP
jgi:hypothetical protein